MFGNIYLFELFIKKIFSSCEEIDEGLKIVLNIWTSKKKKQSNQPNIFRV